MLNFLYTKGKAYISVALQGMQHVDACRQLLVTVNQYDLRFHQQCALLLLI